jgi:hypothetical protein
VVRLQRIKFHSRIDAGRQAGRHVVDSCSDIKQDERKEWNVAPLVLADERISRLQVFVDKWKYCNESRYV